jgi:hypothetical protein
MMCTAANNANFETSAGVDLLELYGGTAFATEYVLEWTTKPYLNALASGANISWCLLYYET